MDDVLRREVSQRLRPVAPPRVIDGVLRDDQYAAALNVIREHGPWDLIIKHHFRSLEELVATTTGGRPLPPSVSLDSFVTPVFRGFFANGGVCFFPEIEPLFYDPRLLEWARGYWGAKYARPMKILFNVSGPALDRDPGHLDSPRFRGMGLVDTPIWLLSVMGKSGLFRRWEIKLAEVITWFYRGSEGGGFTYWPDGPLGAPRRLAAPMWNRGVVTQNTAMYHRGESHGPAAERANPNGLAFDSTFRADPTDADGWLLETNGSAIARYRTDQLRLLVHWDAELYRDMDDLALHVEHRDDITPDLAFEIFMRDLREQGIPFEVPTDPMRDPKFIALLAQTYDVAPASYPAQAPVAGLAA